jgi:hypothetical protein
MRSASLIVSLTAVAVTATAGAPETVFKLAYGVTRLEHMAGTADGTVVLSRRENGNAHGFDVVSFYVDAPSEGDEGDRLSILPIFKDDQEKLELTVGGGADCLLHDFRLVRGAEGTYLLVATREFGDSYVDARPVTFDRYELEHNAAGEVGRPAYYFEWRAATASKLRYCDVGDAFKHELGLDAYRR